MKIIKKNEMKLENRITEIKKYNKNLKTNL